MYIYIYMYLPEGKYQGPIETASMNVGRASWHDRFPLDVVLLVLRRNAEDMSKTPCEGSVLEAGVSD